MRLKFLIITSLFFAGAAIAQTGSTTGGTITSPSTTATQSEPTFTPAASSSSQTAIIDYKSVYESETIEEEVKMAAERYSLTPAQQETWLTAATDRRDAEKKARELLAANNPNYGKDAVYKGLRMAHNTFYETIIGYLSPAQKQAMEADRLILEEKRRRLAKLAPPPPTVTVTPVDSTAIKEAEKAKEPAKKSKKKKKA